MATLYEIAREYADEIRDGIAWVIVWKTSRSWHAEAVWLNPNTDKFELEDLEMAREILEKDPKAVMVNGYYCGHFGEDMTMAELAAGIRYHYENSCNMLNGSTAFPPEPIERPSDLPWYGKATSAEPDHYVYDGYMSPEDYEFMHKHMEADRQKENDTHAVLDDLYIDGQHFNREITELEPPELRNPPSMELTLTIDTAAAILNAVQAVKSTLLRFFESVVKAMREVQAGLKIVANEKNTLMARIADRRMDAMLYNANDHPKWWHYYKHAKKYRVRKKYRRRLERQLCDKQLVAAAGYEVNT